MATGIYKFANIVIEWEEMQVDFFTFIEHNCDVDLFLKMNFANCKSFKFTCKEVERNKAILPILFLGQIYLKHSQINASFMGMAKSKNSVRLKDGGFTNLKMIGLYDGKVIEIVEDYEKGAHIIGSYLIKHYEHSWKFYENKSAIKSLTDKLYNSYVHDFGICSEEMALEYLKSMTGIDFIQSKKAKQKKDGTFQVPVKNVWTGELKDDLVPCKLELTYRYFKRGVHVEVGWSLELKPIGFKDFIIS